MSKGSICYRLPVIKLLIIRDCPKFGRVCLPRSRFKPSLTTNLRIVIFHSNETILSLESYLRYFKFKNHLINFTSPARLFPNYFIKLDLLHICCLSGKNSRGKKYIYFSYSKRKFQIPFEFPPFPLILPEHGCTDLMNKRGYNTGYNEILPSSTNEGNSASMPRVPFQNPPGVNDERVRV